MVIRDGPYFLYYRRTESSEPTVSIEADCDRDADAVFSVAAGEVALEELRGTLLAALRALHAEIAGKSVKLAADLVARLS